MSKAVSDIDLEILAGLIVTNIKQDFALKHLSNNLVNSITVQKTETGITIVIPAEIYDIYEYMSKGVIIRKGSGSYASQLDIEGSKIGRSNRHQRNHKGYVEMAINNALDEWASIMEDRYKIQSGEKA